MNTIKGGVTNHCLFVERTTYYVSSFKGGTFLITTTPRGHSGYTEEFRFSLEYPRGNPDDVPYFLYSRSSSSRPFLTSKLYLSDYKNFPIGVAAFHPEEAWNDTRKIYVIDRPGYQPMISLDDFRHARCCNEKSISHYFYAYDVRVPGEKQNCFHFQNLFPFYTTFIHGNTVSRFIILFDAKLLTSTRSPTQLVDEWSAIVF